MSLDKILLEKYDRPGSPFDVLERATGEAGATLKPDRIAFYSYAQTPWLNFPQRLIDEKGLPSPEEKLALKRYNI